MAQMEKFEITFDDDQAVYREGDRVSGLVTIVNLQDVPYKVVKIELCGIAVVRWCPEENTAHIDPDDISGDTNRDQYFRTRCILLEKDGSSVVDEPATLSAGEHVLPFECKLPPQLPSSFEGKYGQVRYLARATIECPRKSSVLTKKGFTVLCGLDLNFIPEAAIRIELCKYKHVGRCCVPIGMVTVEWLVERSGYVPGESILVHGQVQNDCKAPVVYCKTALNMIITYKVRKRRQLEKREIAVIRKDETPPGETLVYHDPLLIPPLPPTGLGRCKMIDIDYQLVFSALVEGASSAISCTREVYIGTVPVCRREMRSCVAGMFQQPYTASSDDLGQLAHLSASKVSLAQVVATAGAIETHTSPSAPLLYTMDRSPTESTEGATGGHGGHGVDERPPPYAPGHVTPTLTPKVSPVHVAPSAPSPRTGRTPGRTSGFQKNK